MSFRIQVSLWDEGGKGCQEMQNRSWAPGTVCSSQLGSLQRECLPFQDIQFPAVFGGGHCDWPREGGTERKGTSPSLGSVLCEDNGEMQLANGDRTRKRSKHLKDIYCCR